MKHIVIEKRTRKGNVTALVKNIDPTAPEPYIVARDYDSYSNPLEPTWGHGIYFNDLLEAVKHFEHVTKGR